MACSICMAAVFLIASAVVQADQCSSGECKSSNEPQRIVSLLQTDLRMDNEAPDGRSSLSNRPDVLRLTAHRTFSAGQHEFLDVNLGRSSPTKEPVDPLENTNIWNGTWTNFPIWHPAGAVSNVYNGQVRWGRVGYLDLKQTIKLSFVAYPGGLFPIVMAWAVAVGLLLKPRNQALIGIPVPGPPAACPSELSASSQKIYDYWCRLCCMLPSILVFVVPLLMVYISYFWPQEVFTITAIIPSVFVFGNGLYMVCFVPFVLKKIQHNMSLSQKEVLANVLPDEQLSVTHWVIFPNYEEDADIMAAAVGSVAQSTLAKGQIGIVLAMEEREGAPGKEKAEQLRAQLTDKFRAFEICFHPANLPNDPPGKASNVAYAFKCLSKQLSEKGYDASKVLITVADADSEFHANYFELLTREFLETAPSRRNDVLWQSSVLHVKNYHRQPGPVIVGTMFTAMQELACLADPNAVRFPYSTYSLTLALADEVGGWDAEWIAEDWHMGIKCFLLTLGRTTVQPVLLPTLNYTPEADTWMGTLVARFAQAKRHALGFSDLAYFFMMLPLIFVRLNSGQHPRATLADFWKLLFSGMPYLIKFVNVHVVLGIMTLYALLDATLKKVMTAYLGHSISVLFDRTFFATKMFAICSFSMTVTVTVLYQFLYRIVRGHLEKPTSARWAWIFDNMFLHTGMTAVCFITSGPVYFVGLAYAVWVAALKLLSSRTFVYEVALKPSKETRLACESVVLS